MDEEIIEVIADALWEWYDARTGPGPHTKGATHALAALRAEGFDIYRPSDCGSVTVEEDHTHVVFDLPAGTYRLVPAERGDQ